MTCKTCNKAFESKRKTAQFCGATCRKKASRKEDSVTNVTDSVTKPPEVVTVKPLSVTEDVTQLDPEAKPYVPNWQKHNKPPYHYTPTKEAAINYIIEMITGKKAR